MLAVFTFNCAIVAIAVLIHYEFLLKLSTGITRTRVKHRFRIVLGVIGALIAHTIEICVFALAYFLLPEATQWGYFTGNFDGSLSDCIYFSYTTFTTLGFGDIQPHGAIRNLVGLESLTGLLLITWSASFLYYEMQRHWERP